MSAPRNSTGRRRGRRTGGPRKPRSSGPIEPLHPVAEPPDIDSFHDWELGQDVQDAIDGMGITKPTPIQALAIGPVLEGRDVIAKAETGTGKTLAFGAPMMARIDSGRSSVLGLVLSPTRELAEQVARVLEELGATRDLKIVLIVGGEPMAPQVNALQAGAQVVVGTPGRVLDLMNQGFLSFPWTEYAILDEADKMLEIGFIDDVKKILEACNEDRQTLLFSATFPPPLLTLAREYTRDPVEIATAQGVATVETISQYYLRLADEDRARALAIMINDSEPDDVFLVFCDRRTDVDRLARRLERERFSVKALHGGYDQASRFRVMSAFRSGEVKTLLATDVASRGLDVLHVTHVVNFGVPRDVSDYTHRIGRTGRAGRSGVAVTFVMPAHDRGWRQLQGSATFDQKEITSPRDLAGLVRKKRADAPSDAESNARPLRKEVPRADSQVSRTIEQAAPVEVPEETIAVPSSPFGLGLEKESREKPRREPRNQRQAQPEKPAPEPTPEAEPEIGGTGFGAGL